MMGLLSELADAGYRVASVSDLRNSGLQYPTAVPVLLRWLAKVPIEEKEDIVRALSVPWAKSEALDPLITLFKAEPVPSDPKGELLRWAVGNALEVLWDDTRFEELVALTTDARYGKAREMVVLGMGRSKRPEAVDVLIRHLDDPVVSGHAVKALGKLRDPRARTGLESMTTDKRTWVRKAAEKALSRLR
ncbi:MAG TPA: HEAT repeat domain-containing protein [Arthrobacter sp.]